ncbi:MAG: aspartate aminotransferase family protein [Tissierellales bacterium]|jgi:4-aminobutyrate aminotransferase|nr:aspartate aminotransferase family protein [Tissierellales bacterium]
MKNYAGPEKLIELKKQYLFPNAMHFYKNPPQLVRGEMQYLYDSNGKKYLDFFAGVSVMNCGHCNPVIVDATINQLKTLQHTTIIYLTEPMLRLAEKMADVLPGDLKRTFFCTSGSEANEGALLLARLHTNRKKFLTLEHSLHGRTHLTMSATNIPMWRIDPFMSDDCVCIPSFYDSNKELDQSARESLDALETILENNPEDFAALIAEPIQGNGGILTPPKWYFQEMKSLLEKYGVLFIADEVQTGYARTGKMFAIENFDIVPDILTSAKALGNGLPISTFSSNDSIANAFNKPSASTLGGNLVSSATAIAVLDYMKENNLCSKAKTLGNKLLDGLLKLKNKYDFIKDVRGYGLMLGMELNNDKTDDILEMLLERGIILGKNGLNRNVLAFQPPLVIEESDVDFLLENLEFVFSNLVY